MEGSRLVLLSGHSSAVLSMWCQIDNIQQRHHLVANDQLHSLPTLLWYEEWMHFCTILSVSEIHEKHVLCGKESDNCELPSQVSFLYFLNQFMLDTFCSIIFYAVLNCNHTHNMECVNKWYYEDSRLFEILCCTQEESGENCVIRRMKALQSFRMSITLCQSAWHNIPEDVSLHQHLCEKLKSWTISFVFHNR